MIRNTEFSWSICMKLLWLLIFIFPVNALSQEFLPEEDLRLDWTYYDNDGKTMLPFLSGSGEKPHAIHYFC